MPLVSSCVHPEPRPQSIIQKPPHFQQVLGCRSIDLMTTPFASTYATIQCSTNHAPQTSCIRQTCHLTQGPSKHTLPWFADYPLYFASGDAFAIQSVNEW